MRKESLVGAKFGRLTAIADGPVVKGRTTSLCKCDCGNPELVQVSNHALKMGATKSCGCMKREATARTGKRTGPINVAKAHQKAWEASRTHGQTKTRLYRIWQAMHQRCENPKCTHYAYYGGCGITVSEAWKHFEPFRDLALQHGYADDLTIDRINPLMWYAPDNCRWITRSENSKRAGQSIHRYYYLDANVGWYAEFGSIKQFAEDHPELGLSAMHISDMLRDDPRKDTQIIFGRAA